MINVGLVGFGLSGKYLQAPFFQVNANFRLKSIVTSQDIPKNLFPDAQRIESFEKLLEDQDLSLISICSPSHTHFEYAKKCLLAGKNVLLEKPMTATSKEAEELIKLAGDLKLVLYVFQNRRFDSDFMTVKSIIESGVLGEIHSYEAHFDRYKPILNTKRWKETVLPANGILYDLGAHLIDQSIYLFGKPLNVEGSVFTQREGSEIDDAFNLYLDYGKLKVTLKSSLIIKDQGPKYTIHGSKGSFTKFGLDIQEDHLVAGLWPDQPGFGLENVEFNGKLKSEINGLDFIGKVDTIKGNWGLLFNDLFEVIQNNKTAIVQHQQIIEQLKIIQAIKK